MRRFCLSITIMSEKIERTIKIGLLFIYLFLFALNSFSDDKMC